MSIPVPLNFRRCAVRATGFCIIKGESAGPLCCEILLVVLAPFRTAKVWPTVDLIKKNMACHAGGRGSNLVSPQRGINSGHLKVGKEGARGLLPFCYPTLLNMGQDRAVSHDQRPTPKPNKISHIDINDDRLGRQPANCKTVYTSSILVVASTPSRSPVKIGNRSTSAGTGNRGSPARKVTAEARAGPAELLGGTEQFG